MKAITLTDPADPRSLALVETATPELRSGEVLVKVHTAGVNRGDLLQARGHYPPPPGASEIMGLECSGTIVDAGDTGRTPGEEVGCLLAGGGYAEYVAVPQGQLAPVPRGLTLAETGSVMEVACTVWSNLSMVAELREGQRLLIHGGAGGIGACAIQVAKALGAEVAVTAGSAEKLEFCRELGADILINYREQDFTEELRGSCDVILDIIGAKYLDRNMRCLALDGRLVIIGLQGGIKAEVNLGAMLPRRQSIHATTLRARDLEDKAAIVAATVDNVWPMLASGALQHRVHATYPLAQAAQAHAALNNGEVTGKVALEV
ncbi:MULTISPECIES: NAD(P)H-quinone oxidoreductase [unclassified Corynebacterium]|uniref:NAD(P)H-quinone oxidoreductase n=1 Tax=unclassified Corynebacterium TaxID=2624378 RepID=UPI0029CA3ABE|nr:MULTISPECIES: NAD(P)H-quinone oxidoreductase [unclassified Corynebacterium]WPF66250.1 NAD(P)H-quinone oxidoreductase [Corynebacterium sp. 22KM0430]WPF68740.1 NAD(P)H-quinone oxidoreductase [Corynebacterium sp. 21KM1197]